MAFRTIMSPQSTALYPIRVKESLMSIGQEVQAEDRALVAETAQGKRIAIKAGESGRVIQIAPEGAILDKRQMILVIETFDSPADPAPEPTESKEPKSAKKAEEQATAQEPQRDAPPRETSPKAAKSPAQETSAPQSPPGSKTPPKPAKPSKKITFSRVLKGYIYYTLPVIAIIVIQVLFPGFLDRFLGSEGPSGSNSVAGSASSVSGSGSDASVVRFPRPEEYAWLSAPEMARVSAITREGARRFFDIDLADDGSALIVGERYGAPYAFTFDGDHSIFGEYAGSGPVTGGFAFYDLFNAERSALFAFSFGPRDPSQIYRATHALEKITPLSRMDDTNLENFRILSADRAGDFGVMWGENLERNPSDDLPIDQPFILAMSAAEELTRTQSSGGAGHWTINTAELPAGYGPTVSAGYNDAAFWGDPPSASFITRTVGYNDGAFSIDTLDTIDLDLADLMPQGTFSGWRGQIDGQEIGRFEAVALEYDVGGTYSLYAGQFSGTRGQPLPEHFDVFLDIGKPDAPSSRLVLARNDDHADDGLVVRDVMALPQGGFAVLMREEKGAPFTAVVILSNDGRLLSQHVRRDEMLEKMDISASGDLHLVGSSLQESGETARYLVLRP